MQIQTGWLNDPNGMVKYKGKYHLYFQYLPKSSTWKFGIGWGHATSKDLKHWKINRNRSLKPSTEFDRDGCFSGSTLTMNDKIYSVYTGVVRETETKMRETQCIAYSDDGTFFHKDAKPFLSSPPVSNVYGWRDPFIFKYKNIYNMLLGSGWDNQANILLYEGDENFPCHNWKYKGIIAHVDEPVVLECPFIAQLYDNKWILGASCEYKKPIYLLGDFDGEKFNTTSDWQKLENKDGLDIYASTIVYIEDKPYFWSWVRNTRNLHGPCAIRLDIDENKISLLDTNPK